MTSEKTSKLGYASSLSSENLAISFSHFPRSDGGSLAAIGYIALGKLRQARPGRQNIWLVTSAQRSANS